MKTLYSRFSRVTWNQTRRFVYYFCCCCCCQWKLSLTVGVHYRFCLSLSFYKNLLQMFPFSVREKTNSRNFAVRVCRAFKISTRLSTFEGKRWQKKAKLFYGRKLSFVKLSEFNQTWVAFLFIFAGKTINSRCVFYKTFVVENNT